MSSVSTQDLAALPIAAVRRIDGICDRFEAALQAGQLPRLEDYLASVDASEQPALLRQLLLLEWSWRQERGDQSKGEDYQQRFPEHRALIQETREEHERGVASLSKPISPSSGVSSLSSQDWQERGYLLVRLLGRGGMATVYLAHQLAADRLVALKVLPDDPDPQPGLLDRFRREAMALGHLQHPHIVHIFEVSEHHGQPFYSMEYCPGGSLAEYLHNRLLPPSDAATLVATLAQAAHAAHQAGIIHRDLKPANVLLTGQGSAGEPSPIGKAASAVGTPPTPLFPKLADFGLAKRLDAQTVTQTGAVVGTPPYMAPEQARGESKTVGPAADVYALGVILYQCLTGRVPFLGATPLETLLQVVSDEPLPPTRLQAKVPRDLETICLTCLHKEPNHRYSSALALAEDLRRFLDGEPIRARPVGSLERTWRWCRRKPLTVALTAAVLVLVVGVGTGAGLLQRQQAAALAHQRETDQQVLQSLERTRLLLDEGWEQNDAGKIASALSDADKAVEVAHRGGASEAVQGQADERLGEAQARQTQWAKNQALVAALLDVTTLRAMRADPTALSGGQLLRDGPSRDEQFEAAFRSWSPNFATDPIEQVIQQIQAQPAPVVQEVVAGLDAWLREQPRHLPPEAKGRRLRQLVDQLDSSDQGRELRAILAGDELRRERIVVELSKYLLPYSALADPRRGEQRRRLWELKDKVDPTREAVLRVIAWARALDEAGFGPQADRLLFRAQAVNPDQVLLLQTRGELLWRRGRGAEAIECYRAVRALRPQSGVALTEVLDRVGRFSESEAILRDLIRRQPDDPKLHYYLGNNLSDQANNAGAEKAYHRAIQLQEDYFEAHSNLGIVLLDQQKWADAEKSFRIALKLRPTFAKAHYDLGLAQIRQWKSADAEAAFRRATELQPHWAEAYYNCGLAILYQRDQTKLAVAETNFLRAIDLRPDWAPPHNNLSIILHAQGRLPEAVAAVRRAIALTPGPTPEHYQRQLEMLEQERKSTQKSP